MDKIFRVLSSLKLAVALLALLLIGLAAGTIVESRQGAIAAGAAVYYSWWFLALQMLLVVNVAMSLVSLFPWLNGRIGYAIAHASLLIIMLGAAHTFLLKKEGMLSLWEGESGSTIVQQDQHGHVTSKRDLPFIVRLDDFVLDTYPGTSKPSGYASFVQVTDKKDGHSFNAKIWMNNELRYRGYSLFQSSYRQENGREATVLAVSKDPGKNIVFTGYITLLVGMVWILVGRARKGQAGAASATNVLPALLLLAFAPALMGQGQTQVARGGVRPPLQIQSDVPQAPVEPEPHVHAAPASAAHLAELARLPVQHDGRAMPFDTYAREMVKTITGAVSWQGEDAVATVLRWINDPEGASNSSNVKIGSADLAVAMGFAASTKHASLFQLLPNPGFSQVLVNAQQFQMHGMPPTKTIKAALKLKERLDAMMGILYGQTIRPIPIPGEPSATWHAPEALSEASLARLLDGPRLQGWPSQQKINSEILYNNLNPVRLSWLIMLCSLAFSVLAWTKKKRWMDIAAFSALLCGFAMMTWGIQLRWQAGGRIPAANMYESMLFLAWGVGLFALAAYALLRNRIVVLNAAAMAALAMLLTDMLPMDHFIHPIAPVLAGTPWLAIHVPIIMVGYAVLALGMVAAHMQVGAHIFRPDRRDLSDRFYDMLYWYNFVGAIFLLAGILTGSAWAASSWGRYWGWDPKEVWSLVAFLAYMAIAHSRRCGLISKFGAAVATIVAFQTVLMTYLGVNFVLTAGMHSYGMGDSPIALWMLLVALAEAAFIGFGASAYLKRVGGVG
jgi:ABC-type transport system involved in cytochrome c biogenesis permease subunit